MSSASKHFYKHLKVKNQDCPITRCLSLIGGKWKPLILFLIENRVNRFGLIHRSMSTVSKHILTKDLRALEADKLISRTVHAEVPPRVEYALTERGKSLLPIIRAMKKWGEIYGS